jgi:CDP-paratose 2-epimerase
LARTFVEAGHHVVGIDNFIRPGSESNRAELKRLGVSFVHADLRAASDIDALPAADWVIDAAVNPSVLAGVDGAGKPTPRSKRFLSARFEYA